MKKAFFIGFALLVASGIWFYFISNGEIQSVLAQTDEDEATRKRDEQNKKIPQEQVDRAHLEARTIKEAIVRAIAKHKPQYQLTRTSQIHELNQGPGRKGVTLNEFNWRNSKRKVFVVVTLNYNKRMQSRDLIAAWNISKWGNSLASQTSEMRRF